MSRICSWLILFCIAVPGVAHAGADDVTLRSDFLRITEVDLAEGTKVDVDFLRSTFHLDFGFGGSTIGLLIQNATKEESVAPGKVETGYMLTAGHDWILSDNFRLDASTRIGLVETDPGNPLYATDTDIRANLVAFSPDGAWVWSDRSAHPSAYIGSMVNRYGRVQMVAGAGAWWNQIGVYVTGFRSLNGVKNPMAPGGDADRKFAYLDNRGISLSGSYDLGPARFSLRRNFAIKNGGNDVAFTLEWRHEFGAYIP